MNLNFKMSAPSKSHSRFDARDVSFTINGSPPMGEIGLNAVHPGHAGKGIGTRMYEKFLARMTVMGAVLATVGTGGDPSHAAAHRAYKKVGLGPTIPSVYRY